MLRVGYGVWALEVAVTFSSRTPLSRREPSVRPCTLRSSSLLSRFVSAQTIGRHEMLMQIPSIAYS